jgi:hypothetical protein
VFRKQAREVGRERAETHTGLEKRAKRRVDLEVNPNASTALSMSPIS